MMKMTKRRIRRLLTVPCLLLALCLTLSVTALAVNEVDDQGEVPKTALTVKPVVTIQGNVVVDNGKPTGYYELALCVRSARTIVDNATGLEVTEADYANDIAANPDNAANYTVTYYPFSAAAATVGINTDVLTAVNWDVTEVTYAAWDATNGYSANDTSYPRGIDVIANTDPEVWMGTDPDPFPDVTRARGGLHGSPVALDAEGDRSMFTATGQVDDYYESVATGTKTAIVTLSAHAPDNKPVVFATNTPVAVVRFSYDLKRFPKTVVNEAYNNTRIDHDITGDNGDVGGFWLGFDRGDNSMVATGEKTPLTWLADSAMGTGGSSFDFSDSKAATTEMGQVVWTKIGVANDAAGGWDETEYYYYLGAEGYSKYPGYKTIQVNVNGEPTAVSGVALPMTEGAKVLTPGTAQNDTSSGAPAEYTYFENLLRLGDSTLRLRMVNEPTFRRPTGISGPQILFYDWDDTLIGSLMVTKGDVRAQVNAYLEKTLVHPDLRSDSAFMADESGSGGMSQEEKYASLAREYTYRGKYAYTVGGDDAALGVEDGKEYPLTNKLDYVFTKRVNTYLTQTESGSTVQYVHPYSLDDPELDAVQEDGALYPWVYGWAVVEDTRAFNGNKAATGDLGEWKVMHDAAKLEDVWTTMGVGELSNTKRATMTNSTLSTVGTVDPTAGRTAPVFLADNDPAWTDGTRADADNYVYTLEGQNAYLRFADFSDITAEMDRYSNKDTLIVKAVYEEGVSLMDGNHYTLVTQPAYTKWNSVAASAGGAYKVQLSMERSYDDSGTVRGTTRVRMPVIRQDNTIDYKWITNADKGINNDLDNANLVTARGLTQTTYSKVDYDTGEVVTFSLALSARHNKVDYKLIEQYGYNFVVGTQRSYANTDILNMDSSKFVVDNYNYLLDGDSDIFDDIYDSDYSTKDGSHGFVLYGTLGHFLEQATKYNRGEISQTTYNEAVIYTNAPDANLRMDTAGTMPGYSSSTILRNAFLAAALKCEAHKGDPAYDCWDENLDCAKLTYHQAQWFLLDYQGNAGADIRTVAAADADKLSFCHYHISCSGGHVPVAPTTWKELVDKLREYNDAADGSDEKEFAWSDLEVLELSALENMTSIRSNASGRKYTNLTTFLNALLAADAKLEAAGQDVNWVNLQYTILNGEVGADGDTMREEGQERYWWYNGATAAPKVNDFAGLMAAAQTARTPVTTKDGDATFLPQSALRAATYPTGASEYLTEASPTRAQRNAWVKVTDNLVPEHSETDQDPDGVPSNGDEYVEYVYGRFTSMDDFLDKFTAVYYEIYDAVYDAETMDEPENNDAWWEIIQTKLLPDGDNLGVYKGDDSTKFWWKGGNTPFRITNLSTLLECVRRMDNMGGGDADAYLAAQKEWSRITVEEIESAAISQGLRWKGTDAAHPMYPYTGQNQDGEKRFEELSGDIKAEILKQLTSAVKRWDAAVAARPGLGLNWERVQYLILNNGSLPTNNEVVEGQANYYWWKDGNTDGTTVELSSATTVQSNLNALVAATYRADFKDPGVMSSILAATQGADNSFWDFTKLTTQRIQGTEFERHKDDTYDGPDVLDDVKPYAFPGATEADVQGMLNMMTAYRDAAKAAEGITDPYGVPTAYWQQVQYYIFHRTDANPYLPTNSQTFRDLRDQEKALAGDYWWYYDTVRHPPEKQEEKPEPPPNPAAPVLGLLEQIADGSLDVQDFNDSLDPDVLAGWGIVGLDGSEIDWDGVDAIQNGMWEDLPGTVEGNGMTLQELTWPSMQLMFATYARDWYWLILPEYDALDWLVNVEGAMLVSDGGYIPDEYGQIYPEIFGLARSASLFALDMEELTETEVPLAPDMQEAVPEETETAAPETVEDILARIEALERELEALKERLAALEETSAQVETSAETPTVKPASTPVKPAAPAEPEPPVEEPKTPEKVELTPVEPETPAETEPTPTPAPDYGEREETPMGEEAARQAVNVPATVVPSPTLAMLEYKRYLNLLVRA